jgi:hypothetical protein
LTPQQRRVALPKDCFSGSSVVRHPPIQSVLQADDAEAFVLSLIRLTFPTLTGIEDPDKWSSYVHPTEIQAIIQAEHSDVGRRGSDIIIQHEADAVPSSLPATLLRGASVRS